MRFANAMSEARAALATRSFAAALDHLATARRYRVQSAEVQYRLAVANRRYGRLDQVEAHLREAEKLGWNGDDLLRQRLLLRAQVGRFMEVEPQLRALFDRGTHDEAALEVYEALANGYWANHDINEAMKCLNFWIAWRPQDIEPRLMRANVYMEFKDPVSAEKEYREIIQFAPKNGVAHEMLGWVLQEQGKVDDAIAEFQTSLRLNHQTNTVLTGLAEGEVRRGNMEEAKKWLDRIDLDKIELEKKSRVYKLMADIARFQRDHQRAIDILTRVVKEWPHDAGVHQSLSQSYAAIGNRDLANKHLEISRDITQRGQRFLHLKRKVIHQSNDPDLRAEIASILSKEGLMDDAAHWWHSALRCDTYHLASHVALTDYYAKRGDKDMVARHQQGAATSIEITFRRGYAAYVSGDLEGLRARLHALRLHPGTEQECRVLSAGLHNKQRQFKEALGLLDGQTFRDGIRPLALTLCGEALVGLERPLNAESLLLDAVVADPDAVEAHRWLAVIYYDLGVIDRAETHLKRVSELDPADYRPSRLLGLINKDFELFDAAIPHYEESLRRGVNQAVRQQVLLELAECQIEQRRFADALQVLAKAAPSAARETLTAECYYNLGRHRDAVEVLDQVLDESPHHLRALMLRADMALEKNDSHRAVELLLLASEQHPFDYSARRKLAQSLARIGKDAEAREQLTRADELKNVRSRFAKLHEEAAEKPHDAAVRRDLARLAEQMGRPELRDMWAKAAAAIDARVHPLPEITAPPQSVQP